MTPFIQAHYSSFICIMCIIFITSQRCTSNSSRPTPPAQFAALGAMRTASRAHASLSLPLRASPRDRSNTFRAARDVGRDRRRRVLARNGQGADADADLIATPSSVTADVAESPTRASMSGDATASALAASAFVDFFRQASPYIALHRGATFVVLIPGEVSKSRETLENVVRDVALLHDLGVRIVLVVGASDQVSELTKMRGGEVKFVDDYRVTDDAALQACMEANGRNQVFVQALMSRAPTVNVTRRHRDGDGKDDREGGFGNTVAASGNYIFAKRMGTVNGTDFQLTGEVTRVDAGGIHRRLVQGDIVLLTSLGFNAAGEVLNCQCFDVALATAIDLKADKLVVMTDPSHMPYNNGSKSPNGKDLLSNRIRGAIPRFLPLRAAERYLAETYAASGADVVAKASKDTSWRWLQLNYSMDGSTSNEVDQLSTADDVKDIGGDEREHLFDSTRGVNEHISRFEELMERGLSWRVPHCPQELCLATFACKAGVRRAHLIDPTVSGSLLAELYTRDGIGCMVARDRYEGTRLAKITDWEAIKRILAPLAASGTVIQRSDEELIVEIEKGYFHVTERDGIVIACCALKPCGDGVARAFEVAAFAVSPEYRRGGRGDALLEYVENYAVEVLDASCLFLLTTRTADWFVQRGFENKGLAENNPELPKGKKVHSGRGSVLFIKSL